jgi:acetylornithine/succinyldiaminopimelate/putrescine aminotransferase
MGLEEIRRREAAHFLPVVNRLPVALVEGRGSRVVDVDGREYVDLTSGWGVCAIGHCHPALVEAISKQAGRLMQTTNLFYTLPQLDLAETLGALTPEALTRSFFVNSGTEAVEGALKLRWALSPLSARPSIASPTASCCRSRWWSPSVISRPPSGRSTPTPPPSSSSPSRERAA